MRKGAFTRRWFKPIPGFPEYWVNKKGRIFSIKRKVFLVWYNNIKFYPRVSLYISGVRYQLFVHRIVATVWVKNPDPKNKIEVNHDDWDRGNPHAKNLTWMTPDENKLHNKKKPWTGANKYINDNVPVPF